MANPQVEDGHIDIANELGEALCQTYFSPAESKIFWAILRKTYGWHKKSDRISYSQLAEMTGLHSRHVGPALKKLIARNIIFCSNSGERKTSEYGIQKDYDKWELTPISVAESDTVLSSSLTLKSDTDLSVNLTPIPVSDEKNNLTPILGLTDTDIGSRSDTDLSSDKSKKKHTKESIVDVFYSFKNNDRYTSIDFDNEYQKFCDYWFDGKRTLKNVRLSCHNWLDKSLRYENLYTIKKQGAPHDDGPHIIFDDD